LMFRALALQPHPDGTSLRFAGAREAEGPVGETRTFSATVPVKPFRLPR
jgi:hypothetical protein